MSKAKQSVLVLVDQHRRLVEQGTAHYVERCERLAESAMAKLDQLGPDAPQAERDEAVAVAMELKKSAREFLSLIDSYRKLTRQLTDFAQGHQRTARQVLKTVQQAEETPAS